MNAANAFRSVVLPVPVPPETATFTRPVTAVPSKSTWAACERPEPNEIVDVERVAWKPADGEERAIEREGGEDRVHAAPVRKPDVHHRAGVVHPPAPRTHNPLDDLAQVLGVADTGRARA